MSKHLIAIKSEVLNEKAFGILRKYSDYLTPKNRWKAFRCFTML